MPSRLTDELEQLLDDAEERLRVIRSFVALRRWDGAATELRDLARAAEVEGIALIIGARSEATVEQHSTRAQSRRRRCGGPSSASAGQARKDRARLAVESRTGAAPTSAAAKTQAA